MLAHKYSLITDAEAILKKQEKTDKDIVLLQHIFDNIISSLRGVVAGGLAAHDYDIVFFIRAVRIYSLLPERLKRENREEYLENLRAFYKANEHDIVVWIYSHYKGKKAEKLDNNVYYVLFDTFAPSRSAVLGSLGKSPEKVMRDLLSYVKAFFDRNRLGAGILQELKREYPSYPGSPNVPPIREITRKVRPVLRQDVKNFLRANMPEGFPPMLVEQYIGLLQDAVASHLRMLDANGFIELSSSPGTENYERNLVPNYVIPLRDALLGLIKQPVA